MNNYDLRIKDFAKYILKSTLEVKVEEVISEKGYSIMNYSLKASCVKDRDKPYNDFFELLKEDIEKLLNNEKIDEEERTKVSQ